MDQNPLERITALPSVGTVMHLGITLASTVKYLELDTQLPALTSTHKLTLILLTWKIW